MPPSNMFSYLRPGHAKRNASSLASPEPVASPANYPLPSPSQPTEYFTSPRLNDNASYKSSSPISPFPPQLPPIARVASKLDKSHAYQESGQPAGRPAIPTGGSSNSDPGHVQESAATSQKMQDHLSPGFEGNVTSVRPVTANAPAASTHLAPSSISAHYSSFSKSQTSLMTGFGDKLSSTSKVTPIPTPGPTKAKSRLNLRNPMSLLMRRRSGQTLDPLADESLVTVRSPPGVPPIPDNYDPSIRGHIVHDFNAPRRNRNFSHNNAYNDLPQTEIGRVSPQKIDREHTPVFREHFDDDTSYEQSQAAIRAENLANNDFVKRNSYQPPPREHSSPPPPPLPKDPPPIMPAVTSLSPPPARSSRVSFDSGSSNALSPVQELPYALDIHTEATPRKRKSTKTPPTARSRATSITDPSFQPAGLPAHFTSRASRFSFQISSGADSAQEKVLEDRHKQKAAEKASKQARMSTNTVEDDYDEYSMDDYDMDDGFEEDIPMLGEEDDFGGVGDQVMDDGINSFDFSNLSLQQNLQDSNSPMVANQQTLVDPKGNLIGFAMSSDMLQQLQATQVGGSQDSRVLGSGLRVLAQTDSDAQALPGASQSDRHVSSDHLDLDDDMYFDDGLIGEQDEQGTVKFDENMFDDPNGPLFERRIMPPPTSELRHALSSHPLDNLNSEAGYEADDDTMTRKLDQSAPALAHKNYVVQQPTAPTFNSMSAYHNALAEAATRAEAAGRFTREASIDAGQPHSDLEENSSLDNSRPSLVVDEGRFSLDTDAFPTEGDGFGMGTRFMDDYDYSEYDSALEDDPMIAAANAEALAYDDEGFYGQEFGFYASAVGDSPNTWGGFFGPSGLGRSISGRNAMREPNLTPITERSEYSTRNSFISLNHFRDGSGQPIASPGLAQLARMSPYGWLGEEEDISMDTLMKLRKGAFGGSVSSLPGSTSHSPRNSSPMGMQFVPRLSSPTGNRMKEHSGSELESDESPYLEDDFTGNGEAYERLMDAVDAVYDEEAESDGNTDADRPESPTLMSSEHNPFSSPEKQEEYSSRDLPPLPSAAQLQALHSTQPQVYIPTHTPHDKILLPSSASMPLPMSPYGVPLASPFIPQQRSTGPPSIDTSLSSPSATVSTSTGPRRQSLGFSPVSTVSPVTPGGGNWRAGHSRKGSAADSVTYVREHDEAGEGRWVLERRRTAESGELELIGREIVEGGRI